MTLDVDIERPLGSIRLQASFTAPPGVTAIFGRSGSGKTSVINCIAGLLRAEHGWEVGPENVAAFIDPTTVGFADLNHPGTSVVEQAFEFDLVSPSKLYEKFIGHEVRLIAQSKPEVVVSGTLLSTTQGQFVVDTAQGITVVPATDTLTGFDPFIALTNRRRTVPVAVGGLFTSRSR